MANIYLVVSNAKSYLCKSTHTGTPYVKVSNSYLDLAETTTSGTQIKFQIGTKTYRPKQTYTTISTRSSTSAYKGIDQDGWKYTRVSRMRDILTSSESTFTVESSSTILSYSILDYVSAEREMYTLNGYFGPAITGSFKGLGPIHRIDLISSTSETIKFGKFNSSSYNIFFSWYYSVATGAMRQFSHTNFVGIHNGDISYSESYEITRTSGGNWKYSLSLFNLGIITNSNAGTLSRMITNSSINAFTNLGRGNMSNEFERYIKLSKIGNEFIITKAFSGITSTNTFQSYISDYMFPITCSVNTFTSTSSNSNAIYTEALTRQSNYNTNTEM